MVRPRGLYLVLWPSDRSLTLAATREHASADVATSVSEWTCLLQKVSQLVVHLVSRTALVCLPLLVATAASETVLVEAEGFSTRGGWKVDQQFVQQMGSPYLLAHGLGHPVANAEADVTFPTTGLYRVWVRTRDWVPEHDDDPGRFRVLVAGQDLGVDFGTELGTWHWQDGGVVSVTGATTGVALHDLTGFEGRCDALAFLGDTNAVPPNDFEALWEWRRVVLGDTVDPPVTQSYDCVVVGGGIAGTAAIIAASRGGASVALVQDRPVLGGNASQDVRVHTLGKQASDRNNIVSSLQSTGTSGLDTFIGYDTNRFDVVNAETNITLVMPWRAYGVVTNADRRITAVDARHISTGERMRLQAPIFIDCTGDGWIGYWAGASFRMGSEARAEFNESIAPEVASTLTMGNTVWWESHDTGAPYAFPEVPWAMDVAGSHSATKGDWYWEYGLLLNTIDDAEHIRDHLFRAIYGSFYNAKQNTANANRDLYWMAYIAGKRESRRLMGDHILTENDVRNSVFFEDAVASEVRDIDLHYPRTSPLFYTYADFFGINEYFIPLRCLYSRDIPNLMMAGRCFSCTRVGLGSPRVMNTGGQMGVACGYAASLCKKYGIEPRDIYRSDDRTVELQALIGGVWPERPVPGGVILDNTHTNSGVAFAGSWTLSTSSSERYGDNYRHDGDTRDGKKLATYTARIDVDGDYEIAMWWPAGVNRASNVPIAISPAVQAGAGASYISVTEPDVVLHTNEMWVGRNEPSDYFRGLLDFDLSTVPSNAIVFGASLSLTAQLNDPGSGGGTIGDDGIRIYRLTEGFSPTNATWNERDPGVAWSTSGGTFDSEPLAIYKGRPYPDGITAGESIVFDGTLPFVAAVSNSLADGHIGIIVRTPSIESNSNQRKLYRFASPTSTNVAWRPRLSVSYFLPGSHSVTVNQQENGGRWNMIATHALSAGDVVSVIIRNNGTDGHVMADAVRFQLADFETGDRDNDGLPNWWERWYFLDETAADAGADNDGDGRSNYAEYRCGTDPWDALSVLTVRDLLGAGRDGNYALRWPSSSNRLYTISAATSLSEPFVPIAGNIAATPPENAYTVTVDRVSRFYRISVE